MALTKDPDAVLDYTFDWSAWLEDGETIVSHEVAIESGDAVIESASQTDTLVIVWVSGGTLNTNSVIRCRVTTSEGRIDDRTITLMIREVIAVDGCEAWPVLGCNIAPDVTPETLASATRAAQVFLNGLTGNRFGTCTYTHRFQVRAQGTTCLPPSSGGQCCMIQLPKTPIQGIIGVRVDGVLLDPTSYHLVGGGRLVRPGCWPTSTDCEPGRVEVTYTAGIPLCAGSAYYDIVGAAMGEVVREYAEAMCGRVCKLPSRFVAVNRQGVSTAALDPVAFLRLGITGMPLTDNLVRTVNPSGLRRKPRVVSIDGPRRY